MLGRRLFYLAVLGFCLVFYCFYQEWFSWLLLVTVVALPWFSLALSLPAMLTAKAVITRLERTKATLKMQEQVLLSLPKSLPNIP